MRLHLTTRMITRAALFGVLTYVFSWIRIPVGPVPVTLQTLTVLLAGLLLKPSESFLAMLLHLLLKIILGGENPLLSPAFGFVIAFVIVAPLLSYLTQRRIDKPILMGVNIVIATCLIYLIGIPYMAMILRCYMNQRLSFGQILSMGMLVFLPGDAIKAVIAWFAALRLRPILFTE